MFYVTLYTAFEVLNVANDFYRYIFQTFYFCITFTEMLFFRHFLRRHLLTLLTLNVANHSSGSKTLASLRYTRSELLSLHSHRLKNLDVISAIEPHGDEGRLHDLTPAGCIAMSFLRDSRGGGIAVVYSKCLPKRISITATFPFHHQSFEVIRLSITLTSGNINFFCLYRPPPSRINQLTDTCFLSDFSFLLDQCNTLSSKNIIF